MNLFLWLFVLKGDDKKKNLTTEKKIIQIICVPHKILITVRLISGLHIFGLNKIIKKFRLRIALISSMRFYGILLRVGFLKIFCRSNTLEECVK